MAADDILFAPIGAKTDIVLPESWIEVIEAIKRQPNWAPSTLAGGALRDLDNGRPVKDVDIFVPYLGDNEHALKRLENALLHTVHEVPHSAHNASQLGAPGISHFHIKKDGWLFEISQKVETFDYASLLDDFDIGICMISLDPNNVIYRTPEYKLDKSNKELRVVRLTGGRETEHAERLKRKYSDWKIVPL